MASYTYRQLYLAAKQELQGCENGEFAARQLVAAATGRTVSQLIADLQLTAFHRDIETASDYISRYKEGEPLAYILGKWEFYGLPIHVCPDVLIPRDDTMVLCDLAIHRAKLMGKNPRILDLCAGTGCIGLAIASRVKDVRVTLGEISPAAIRVAKKNIQENKLSGRVSCYEMDARKAPPKFVGTYDMIVSNPPYITGQEMGELDPSVRDHEPHLALYGGEDGLDFYRDIVEHYTPILRSGGYLAFEFGMGQENDVAAIMFRAGYENLHVAKDSGERFRAIIGRKKSEPQENQ